ncbi:MAG TPA: type IV pilus twitching motility protein PilT [Clostridia bacterium]|nr:type IV pilus twitching motility protein PilT [Clostridia bacterium]HHY06582.1 type IV pilus twitching motility protein PilT [Clostridia bacterium]
MDVIKILKKAIELGASDIHFSVGTQPTFRINGILVRWKPEDEEAKILKRDDIIKTIHEIMERDQLVAWQNQGEYDFSYSLPGIGRFRVNVFRQRGCPSLAIRPVPYEIPPLEKLGVPESIVELAKKKDGLILVTGTTGCGKSTTLAALINKINMEEEKHIITIEDPIEYLYQHKKSIVNQRELGGDTASFAGALRACLRQDPDVILIGELRDLETIATAITAAETGHLVFATLHTRSAAQSIDRIIDVFPANQQTQIKVQLAATLQGIITQQLLPRADGNGMALVAEILISIPAIRNLIREGKTHQIPTVLQTGARWGMQTMEIALCDLVKKNIVTMETALNYINDKESFKRLVNARNYY